MAVERAVLEVAAGGGHAAARALLMSSAELLPSAGSSSARRIRDWLLAAAEKTAGLRAGWEDSTLGNMFVARHLAGDPECLTQSAAAGGDVGFSRLVPTSHRGRSAHRAKSVEGSQAISDLRRATVSLGLGSGTDRSGLTFARSPTRRPRTAPTRAPSPMKKLLGASSTSRHRSS